MIKAVSALHRIESSVSLLKSPNFRLEKVTHSLFLSSVSLISIFPLLGFGVLPLFALEEGAIRIQQRREEQQNSERNEEPPKHESHNVLGGNSLL